MQKYKIVEKIASGSEGTVFKATYKNKIYAVKITNILKKDSIESLKSPTWREIYFATTMNKKYPLHFMKLYDHEISHNCREQYFMMKIDDINPPELRKKYINLVKSGVCSIKVYTYVDFVLSDMLDKLTIKQIYSGLIQLSYIIYLVREEGFINYDFGPNNVGMIKTKKTSVKIFDHNIPTYGYIYMALDYGKIYSKNFIHTTKELNDLKSLTKFIKFELLDTYCVKFMSDKIKSEEDKTFINQNQGSPLQIIKYLSKKYYRS